MFIPSTEAHDTSYFMNRYIWNPEDDHVYGGSDFDDMTETCSSASYTYSNTQSEDVSAIIITIFLLPKSTFFSTKNRAMPISLARILHFSHFFLTVNLIRATNVAI